MAAGTPFRENVSRLWLTVLGQPPVNTGRSWLGEVLHAAMNVWVEWVRSWLPATWDKNASQAAAKLLLVALFTVLPALLVSVL